MLACDREVDSWHTYELLASHQQAVVCMMTVYIAKKFFACHVLSCISEFTNMMISFDFVVRYQTVEFSGII